MSDYSSDSSTEKKKGKDKEEDKEDAGMDDMAAEEDNLSDIYNEKTSAAIVVKQTKDHKKEQKKKEQDEAAKKKREQEQKERQKKLKKEAKAREKRKQEQEAKRIEKEKIEKEKNKELMAMAKTTRGKLRRGQDAEDEAEVIPETKSNQDNDSMSQMGDQAQASGSVNIDIDDSDSGDEAKKKKKGQEVRESSTVSQRNTSLLDKDKDKNRKDKKKKDKDKKKKDKSDKKKDKSDKKKDKKKSKSVATAKSSGPKPKVKRSGSSSEDSDEAAESDHWSAGDNGVEYGSAVLLSDDSGIWPDNLSNELYDSDNPDCPLNAYHIESKPRLLQIEDKDEKNISYRLDIDCLNVPSEPSDIGEEKISHQSYQNYYQSANSQVLTTHNMLTSDFVRATQQTLLCPICQSTITNPVQFKMCVHRFCAHCIEAYNRQGKKECPLCRVPVQNRRQLRPDKNLGAMLKGLDGEIKRLEKLDELENEELKRKVVIEQKKMQARKEKQSRQDDREKKDKEKNKDKESESNKSKKAKPKPAETPEESRDDRLARLAKEKAQNPQVKKTRGSNNFGGEGVVDTSHVIRVIDERKQLLPNLLLNVDIEIVLKHDLEQSALINGVFVKRIRMHTNRHAALIHLAILISHRNGLREEEWPNFEFTPCLKDNKIREERLRKQYLDGQLRPFPFRMSIFDILKILFPGEQTETPRITLIYKKKPMPQITTRNQIVKGLTAQCIIPPVIKDEAIRKHAMPYTPGYNPTNTLQGMLQAKAEAQAKMAGQKGHDMRKGAPQANFPQGVPNMNPQGDVNQPAPQANVMNQNNSGGHMFMGIKTDVPLNQQSPAQIQAAVAAQYPGLLPDSCLNPEQPQQQESQTFQGIKDPTSPQYQANNFQGVKDPASPFQGVKEGDTSNYQFANQNQYQ